MKITNTRLAIGLVCILMIVSLACQLPFLSRETISPTELPTDELPASTEVIQPAPAAESLPPAIVETEPLTGSTISLQQRFVLVFNQPMEQATVQDALAISPNVSYSLNWLDDRSMELSLDESLPMDSGVSISLADSIQSTNGLTAGSEIVLDYQTAGSLQLTDAFPDANQTDVTPRGTIMVTFNQPVVELGNLSDIPAFTLEPAAQGNGEWLNTSTYVFYPQPGLAGGTEYTLQLNTELTSQQGAVLELSEDQTTDWTFTTAPPKLLTIDPEEGDAIDLDTPFVFTFNQSMDTESVESHFSLVDNSGIPVSGQYTWSDDSSVLTFTPDELLERNTSYYLQLDAEAAAMGGTPLNRTITRQFITVGNLSVVDISVSPNNPLVIYYGYSSIQITFNAPIADADYTDLASFDPQLVDPYYYVSDSNTLILGGYFNGSTTYELTLNSEIKDKWGQRLGSDYLQVFSTSPLVSQLNIPLLQYGTQDLFITPKDKALSAVVVNISSVSITSEETNLTDFIDLLSGYKMLTESDFHSNSITWWQNLNSSVDKSQTVDIFLQSDRNSLQPGLYLYQVTSPELDYSPSPFFLVVSDLSIMLKHSDQQVFVWVVDLNTNQPAGDISLDLYSSSNNPLASCLTDADGRCTFNLDQKIDSANPLIVMHGQPGDEDFGLATDSWTLGVTGSEFGYYSFMDTDLVTYLYTDRPIYRPGQTVYYRVIAQQKDNARYVLADLGEIHLEVYGTYQEETGEVPLLESIPVTLSDYGSGWGSFDLPENAPAGEYSIQIPENQYSYFYFQVADYRKPEIDLNVEFDADEAVQGDDLSATVTASYYFGASAANVPVSWSLYAATDSFDLPYGYQTGNQTSNWQYDYWQNMYGNPMGTYVMDGVSQTGLDGSVKIEIPYEQIKDKVSAEDFERLTLEATIQNDSAIPVSARDSMSYHPDIFYIGVRSEQWGGIAGNPLGFAIQTADLKKNAVAGKELTASLKKIHWVTERNEVSGYIESIPEYTTISSVNLTTDENGQSRVEMTPDEPGNYVLEVTGGKASTQLMVWVGGSGNVSWPNLTNQQLPVTLDQEDYQAGDTAHLFIPNPFESALALITVERAEVMQSYVREINDAQLEFPLEILENYAPNVYASITLIDASGETRHEYRQGYVNIPVDPQELTLQVDLQATPEVAEPGGSVELALTVTDWQGNPVEGEFSLSMVDKAVLALAKPNAEDILTEFYGTQSLSVWSSFSLAGYAARQVPTAAGGMGGGGESLATFLREDFKDTAYWNGSLVTDSNGRASVVVTLPDNVTTWVVSARGLTQNVLVGESQIEITTSRPLLITPVAPRFSVVGDHLQVAALVHNNTANDLSVDVSLQASGFVLDGDAQMTVEVPANDSQRVEWWGTVENVNQIDLTYSALSSQYQDASVPEEGSIPVLHYSSPQTFATSGILTEAGGKLEAVSLPYTWQPTGGELTVELSPSLAASILTDMEALQNFDTIFTETIISQLLPNLEMLDAVKTFGLDEDTLSVQLTEEIQAALAQLPDLQNSDGGWGWMKNQASDGYISAYVLLGLTRAQEVGFDIDADMLQNTQAYFINVLATPDEHTQQWELDRLVFENYALMVSGIKGMDSQIFLDYRDQLNPWAKALLALSLSIQEADGQDITGLMSEIESLAEQTATGVHWTQDWPDYRNPGSNIFNSSVVIYALSKLDPASSLLPYAVRYLAAHRNVGGGWNSSYDSAWSLRALIEVMKGTGELQANYEYSASINETQMISGQAQGLEQLTTVSSSVPISNLLSDAPNALRIQRGDGEGRLHYRAYLQVDRPVEQIQAVDKGISVERSYSLWGEDCSSANCTLIDEYSLSETDMPVLAHVTLTVPEDMYYVVVEDWLPAGAEIVDNSLLISQQGSSVSEEVVNKPLDADVSSWANWYFGDPEISRDHVRWVAAWLPAGTYELTYKFTPYLAGEYRVLPARAWQYYFPEVEGATAGEMFDIRE